MVGIDDDATALLGALREGSRSSAELLQALRDRIAALDGELNAVVAHNFEAAQARAEAADAARARGESWGPLHGLPMSIKDTFETTGMPTTSGAERYRDHRPDRNSSVVQALLDAGAILYGKTNLPVFAGEWQSFNPVHGTTRNPHDLTRTPGGSSGGSAAALAAGMTPLEVGSDIGGSIRIPCHFCGVYGHKPSHGLISLRGHIPGPPGTVGEPDLAVAGPMARSARDLELAFDVLVGPDAEPPARSASSEPPLSELRLAVYRDDPDFPLESDVASALEAALARLAEHGARWKEGPPAGLTAAKVVTTYVPLLAGIVGTGVPHGLFRRLQWTLPLMKALAARQVRSPIPPLFMEGVVQTHRTWLSHNERRAKMGTKIETWFEDFDLLIMPVAPWTAFPHAQKGELLLRTIETPSGPRPYADHLSWVGLPTMLGLPATSVPIGLTEAGLPVGIQVIAPRGQDRRSLAFARRLEAILGGFSPPAPLAALSN